MELFIKMINQNVENYNMWCDMLTLPSHKKENDKKAIEGTHPIIHLSDYAKEVMNAK